MNGNCDHTPWSDAERVLVRKLWAEGLTMSQIGERMNRTRHSVRGEIKRKKLERRAPPVWPPERIEAVRNLWLVDELSASQVGKIVGCSRCSIVSLAHRFGWKRAKDSKSTHAIRVRAGTRKSPSNVLKFGGARMSPTIKPPVALPAVEPLPEHAVTLQARERHQCCYPVGEAMGADQLYCGAAKEGTAHDYCAWHRGIMWRKAG